MQGVMVLNGSKINSDGSYSLPAGTDKAWFNKFKAKDYRGVSVGDSGKNSKEQGYKLFASGALWVDKNGQLRTNGSAEASAYLVNLKTKGKFEIAGVKFNGEGHAFDGGHAASDIKASLGKKGLAISAEAEALLGTKAGASGGFIVGKGILSLQGDAKAEAIVGAWVNADGKIDISKYGISAFGKAEAKAGAEGTVDGNIQTGNGPIKLGGEVKGNTFAGTSAEAHEVLGITANDKGEMGFDVGASAFYGAKASAEGNVTAGYATAGISVGVSTGVGAEGGLSFKAGNGHIKADLDLGATVLVGANVNVSFDIDYGQAEKDIDGFISWINPFD